MTANNILTLSDIHKSFASKTLDHDQIKVLNGIDLTIPRNSIISLSGGNGSGKTTLFNIISGLLKADSGEIEFYQNNKSISLTELSVEKRSEYGIGRMFQGRNGFYDLTVEENLLISCEQNPTEKPLYNLFKPGNYRDRLHNMKKQLRILIDRYMEEENPELFLKKKLSTVTPGKQRLLGFIQLMLGSYELILLDEPCSGLFKGFIPKVEEGVKELKKQGKTVCIIEHNLDFVKAVSDRVFVIKEGKLN